MPRRSRPCPSAARAAVLALMLLASRPAAVDGFAAIHGGGWCGIRSEPGPVRSSGGGGRGGESTRSSSIGGGSCCRASRTLLMGASRDDHTNRRDQWEGWDMEDNGGEDEVMLDVKRRDWRQFRKDLVARYGEDNGKDPWADGCWAHDIGTVEAGSLLLATEEIRSGTFHQSVILILSHGRDQGTLGLILNRPGPQRLHSLPGLQPDLAEVFGNSQVFDGGPMGLGTMTVLHDANVVGSDPVLNGVYAGGFDSLVEATRKGRVSTDHVRFVHGHSAWSPGQLQGELDHNQWFVAAAAPELITGNCDKPFDPLWGKLLRLMGGRYGDVAKRNEPRM